MKKLTMILAVVMLFAGCAKDGATGPQGPAGPAGASGSNGANGTNGVDGINGTNGNANVHAYGFTITPGQWITSSASWKYYQYQLSQITQDILDNGMIVIYWKVQGYQQLLPYTFYYGSSSGTLSGVFKLNTIEIDLSSNTSINVPTVNYDFKVVIASGNRETHPGVNWDDYNSVKAAFNLKD